jgi:ribosome recycling factor
VTVEVYGSHMPLNQVGTVTTPEPRMLAVQVWDKQNVGPVDKAIRSAGLGLTPIVVFNIREHGNFAAVLAGEGVSTIVQQETN